MKNITLEAIYEEVVRIQHDVDQIKKVSWKIQSCAKILFYG